LGISFTLIKPKLSQFSLLIKLILFICISITLLYKKENIMGCGCKKKKVTVAKPTTTKTENPPKESGSNDGK
jgi:hypothetical protein